MIYLDNAATTWPKPDETFEAVRRVMKEAGGNPGRAAHALSLRAAEEVEDVRAALCDFLDAPDPDHLVFTLNATYALNMAIRTRIRPGAHVLISDREHNAVYRPVARLAKEGIADFDVFRTSGNVTAELTRLLRPETAMLICNHVSNVDGREAPIGEIAAFCRAHGICFILDASQSAGHRPLSVRKTGADVVCAPGHKGLFGLPGVGFAWFRAADGLRPFVDGGSGSSSRDPEMPRDLPERLEAGTLPTAAIASLGGGLRFLAGITAAGAREKETTLLTRLSERLDALPGVRLYTAGEGGILSFTHKTVPADRIVRELDAHGFCVRGGLHCAPLAHAALGTLEGGTVRVSLSCRNRLREIDEFAAAVREIVG